MVKKIFFMVFVVCCYTLTAQNILQPENGDVEKKNEQDAPAQSSHDIVHSAAIDDELEKHSELLPDVESVDEAEEEEFDLSDDNQQEEEPLILLDKIEAVVAEGDNFQVIAMSDIAKRDFDGAKHSLDDIINENLMDLVAQKLKISVDEDDINKYLQRIKLSKEQIKAIARANGYYDLAEFYEQFKKMYRANQALGFKIQSELIFPEEVLQQYCEEHPVVEEAIYTVEIATVPFNGNKQEQRSQLEKFVAGDIHMNLLWGTPIELKEGEVSQQNDFLFTLPEGKIYLKESSDGFDLFKMKALKPHRVVPLSERRQEILSAFKAEHYDEALERVYTALRQHALILQPSYSQYPLPTYVDEIADK